MRIARERTDSPLSVRAIGSVCSVMRSNTAVMPSTAESQ